VGDGTFGEPTHFPVGEGPHSIRAGDLDADGFVDLVTANEHADAVSVLMGAGDGTFGPITDFPTGRVPKGVAIADFDGDGAPDVLTANTAGRYPTGEEFPGGSQVSVLLGAGDGTFGPPTDYLAGNAPFAVTAGRFDGDDRTDLVTANWFGNGVSVLLSLGPSTSSAPEGLRYASDLPWMAASNGFGPVERDRTNGGAAGGDGREITLDGVGFAKGLGVHAPSEVRFAVGNCSRFRAAVGLEGRGGPAGSVTFEIYGDGTRLFDSGPVGETSAALSIDVPVAGVSELRLVVGDASDGDDGDFAVWADARLDCPATG
jgi:hypothetical protein